jgi:hypothetical protein
VYRRILARMEQVAGGAAKARPVGRRAFLPRSLRLSDEAAKVYIGRGLPVFPPRSPLPPEVPRGNIEAAAGRRALPFHYEPALDCVIDNGNHLILSGNRAA